MIAFTILAQLVIGSAPVTITFIPPAGATVCALFDVKTGEQLYARPPETPTCSRLPMPPPGVLATVRCGAGDPVEWGAPAVWSDGRRAPTLFWGGPLP